MSPNAQSRAITAELASYAAGVTFATLPDVVKMEAARAFMNWMGCALGGCREEAVAIAAATVAEFGGPPQATVIGYAQRSDVASAAFVNCIASSVLAFDDAHLATVTHPSGPAAASLFAVSQKYAVSGEDFLAALALAIEVECRISNALLLPPSKFNVGFYVTGLSGPIGVAAGIGSLLHLDARGIRWAMGIAASQASGFRTTHGTMTAHFRPGHATRAGVWGALLAAKEFTCSDQSLEAEKGFFDVFSVGADLQHAVNGLGRDFEMMRNCYKPYPCGIVIHPTIDACREIRDQLKPDAVVTGATLRVHPLTLALTGRRAPTDPLEAAISVFHCAAAALLRGRLGLSEMRPDCINDSAISVLRERIEAAADPQIHSDESIVEAKLADGSVVRAHVTVTRGSMERPMTDSELDAKFMDQAQDMLSHDKAAALRQLCRNAATLGNVGRDIDAILKEASVPSA